MPNEPTPGRMSRRKKLWMVGAATVAALIALVWLNNSPAPTPVPVAPIVSEQKCECEKPAPVKAPTAPKQAVVAKAPVCCIVPAPAVVVAVPPAPMATPAPAATPAPQVVAGQYEIVVSFANWAEEIRPAFQGGRVDGRIIGQAMQAGKATRYSESTWAKLVSGDGAVVRLKSELKERGGMPVNEIVYPMPREAAANFQIQNIVLENSGFIAPRNQFVAEEIKSSVARGSARIVFFVVAAPGGVVPTSR